MVGNSNIVHFAVMRSRYDLTQGPGAENVFSLPVAMRRSFFTIVE